MTNAIFEPKNAQPSGDFTRQWVCFIPVDKKSDRNAAEYSDLFRSDYWQYFVRTKADLEPGDILICIAKDYSFYAQLLVRGVDRRNARLVVGLMTGSDFRDPVLIDSTLIIQKAGKVWSVHKKVRADSGVLELVKGGFASVDEAREWAERQGAVDITLIGAGELESA